MRMSEMTYDIHSLRNVILESQHLLRRSSDTIEQIVSDLCGLQYDPYPAIQLNQYMMLWNRKRDFKAEQLDIAAYQEFKVVETWAFRRNMFFIPRDEYSLYRHATKNIVRWGESDEDWFASGDTPEIQAAEHQLKERLTDSEGLTANQIWEKLGLSDEWEKYRREHDQNYNLPIFRAFYRMVRRGDLLTCGRNPGTFREPVFVLKEKVNFPDWMSDPIPEKEAVKTIVEKLIASFAVTDPVHVSHISGYKTADILPVFEELEAEKKIVRLPYKIGRKYYHIHASKLQMLNENRTEGCCEVRLLSPMDTIVRDKAWLTAFFDYSFSFEYFKKKGMKWPLSILVGNRFVGYLDCKMEWRTKRFLIKEKNIFDPSFKDRKAIDLAIEELAAFHGAKEILEKP